MNAHQNSGRIIPGDWHDAGIPGNVILGNDTFIETSYSFLRYRSLATKGLTVGCSSAIYKETMFDMGPDAQVVIGDFVLLNGPRLICDTRISIGDYTMVSWRVVIMDTLRIAESRSAQRTQLEEVAQRADRVMHEVGGTKGYVEIGSNVWIGFDTCILPNVTIGDGAVIGARSVVTADVPPHTIVAGNPAVFIRKV